MSVALDKYGLLPTLTVEIDKTNQPTNPTRVWTDITGYVRTLTFTLSGRNDEFQRTTPGVLQLVVNNRDDAALRFETLGVTKAQWVRVSATWQGTTYRLWQGVIEELVRQWPSMGQDATINLTAVDGLKLCRLYDLAGTTFPAQRVDQRVAAILALIGFPVGYPNAVAGFVPSLYWRLGESSGTNAADASGNGRSGTYGAGVTLGQTGALVGDANTAVSLTNTSTSVVTSTYSPFVAGSKRTFMGWAKRTATTDADTLFSDAASVVFLQLASGNENVVFQCPASNQNGLFQVTWSAAWPGTGQWVHWALVYDANATVAELFIGGVSQGQQTVVGGTFTGATTFTVGGTSNPFNGQVDEVAVFESALTARQIATIYQAGTVAPAGTFDTDTDTVDAVTTPLATNSDALNALLALEGSTNGLLIANGDGSMSFQGRHWRMLNASTATATFADNGTGIPYTDNVQDQDDDTRIANVVNVTALGASAPTTVSDSPSQLKYFSRTNPSVDRSLLSSSASLALSAAQWLLAKYKDPSPRIPTLEVKFQAAAKVAASYGTTLLNAKNSQRFTWKRTTASPRSQDAYVEQVTHTIDPRVPSWTTTLAMSPADAETTWLLGDATFGVLGTTTKLAY